MSQGRFHLLYFGWADLLLVLAPWRHILLGLLLLLPPLRPLVGAVRDAVRVSSCVAWAGPPDFVVLSLFLIPDFFPSSAASASGFVAVSAFQCAVQTEIACISEALARPSEGPLRSLTPAVVPKSELFFSSVSCRGFVALLAYLLFSVSLSWSLLFPAPAPGLPVPSSGIPLAALRPLVAQRCFQF